MKILLIVGFIISHYSLFSQSTFLEGRGANGQGLSAKNVDGISTLTTTLFGLFAGLYVFVEKFISNRK